MLHRHLCAATIVGVTTICTLTAGFVRETQVVAQDISTSERQFDAASVKVNRTRGGTTRRIEQDRLKRFHLALHRETRTLPVYALVVAKGGPQFKEGDGGATLVMPDGTGAMKYQNYPMAALATLLSVLPTTGRPVLDRTGLTGRYTFTANLQNVPAGLTGADQKNAILQSDTPAFTALQEQLGLKLEPERAAIDMIVV